jgi:ankyrin repeat protein
MAYIRSSRSTSQSSNDRDNSVIESLSRSENGYFDDSSSDEDDANNASSSTSERTDKDVPITNSGYQTNSSGRAAGTPRVRSIVRDDELAMQERNEKGATCPVPSASGPMIRSEKKEQTKGKKKNSQAKHMRTFQTSAEIYQGSFPATTVSASSAENAGVPAVGKRESDTKNGKGGGASSASTSSTNTSNTVLSDTVTQQDPCELLMTAAQNGDDAAVRKLIEHGLTNLHIPRSPDKRTLMMMAIQNGHYKVAELLLNNCRSELLQRPDVLQLQDVAGNTALMLAVISGMDKMVERLVRHSKPHELQVRNRSGFTALMLALDNKRIIATRYLLAAGADVPNAQGYNALLNAVIAGRWQYMDVLIKAGAMINQTGPKNVTPLSAAVLKNEEKWVQKLLEAGARPDESHTGFDAPLAIASRNGNASILAALLQHGAKVSHVNHAGESALHIAAQHGHANVADLLIFHHADLEMKDEQGCTPLHVAARYKQVKIVQVLLDAGAPIEIADKYGCTPLHYAAQYGDGACCKLLLDRGADLDAKDNHGKSVIAKAGKSEDPTAFDVVNAYHLAKNGGKQDCIIS